MRIPSEFVIGEILLPPLLIAAGLGIAATWLTRRVLNRYRLSRLFAYPPLVLLAMAVIYTVLIGEYLVPV